MLSDAFAYAVTLLPKLGGFAKQVLARIVDLSEKVGCLLQKRRLGRRQGVGRPVHARVHCRAREPLDGREVIVESKSAYCAERLQATDHLDAFRKCSRGASGRFARHSFRLQERVSASPAVKFSDGHIEPLDLGIDAPDLLLEIIHLRLRHVASFAFAFELLPEFAVRRARGEPFGTLCDPAFTVLAFMRVREFREDVPKRLEGLELLAHLSDRVVDVAIGPDRLAQLAHPHVVLFENVVADELGGGLIMVERHRIDDRLLQRIGVLLTYERGVRYQVAHVLAHKIDCLVAMVDEVVRPDHRHNALAYVVPFGGEAAFLSGLDEILCRKYLAHGDESGEHRLVALGLARLDRHADGDRRALAICIGETERDIGACLLAPALILAERAETIVGDAAFGGAATLALVARHRIQAVDVAVATGERDLRHVEDGGLAGAVLAEYAGVAADLDVLEIEQMPVHHSQMPQLHHASLSSRTADRLSPWRT